MQLVLGAFVPTQAALWQAIMRANYQTMVWSNDIEPDPQLPFTKLWLGVGRQEMASCDEDYHQHPKLLFIQ